MEKTYEKCSFTTSENIKVQVELGHSYNEWEKKYSGDVCWDFCLEDIISCAIEPNEDMVYWLIDGRLYETEC